MKTIYIKRIRDDAITNANPLPDKTSEDETEDFINGSVEDGLCEYQKYEADLLTACESGDTESCRYIIELMRSVVKDMCCKMTI
jgi:hypothetical protein